MLWLQLHGLKWGPAPSKGVNTDTVPEGLIMPEGREIEEIWVDLSYRSILFFQNQAGYASAY
jgi:hypothetical protein